MRVHTPITVCVAFVVSACSGQKQDVSPQLAEAHKASVEVALKRIGQALEMSHMTNRELPASLDLLVASKHLQQSHLVDPWGRAFTYSPDGATFVICSKGPDEADPADDMCRDNKRPE